MANFAESRLISMPCKTQVFKSGERTFLPHQSATRCAQQKIFQDKFAGSGSKRRTANPARYFAVNSFRSGFGDHLIKRVAAWALEKLYPRGSGHDAPPKTKRVNQRQCLRNSVGIGRDPAALRAVTMPSSHDCVTAITYGSQGMR